MKPRDMTLPVSSLVGLVDRATPQAVSGNDRDFTGSHSKIGHRNAVLQILFSERRALQGEILSMSSMTGMPKVTVAAMVYARRKVSPAFMEGLFRAHAGRFEREYGPLLKRFCGWRVLAVDGSRFKVPTRLKNIDDYACEKDGCHIGEISELHDVLNGHCLDMRFSRKGDEHSMAMEHVGCLRESPKGKTIVVFDRGYPSHRLMLAMEDAGLKYVIRLPSYFFAKERKSMGEKDDATFVRRFTGKETKNLAADAETRERLISCPQTYRLVRLAFGGTEECLATNLTEKEMPKERMGELYHLRWDEETGFRHGKQRNLLDAFTGRKYEKGLLRDLWAAEIMRNTVFMTMFIAGPLLEGMQRMHAMKANYANTLRSLTQGGIARAAVNRKRVTREMLAQLEREIKRDAIPIRPGRTYERKTVGTSRMDAYKR